jgi:hypothetical protein
LDALTASQLAEWEAFYRLEPFGNEQDNHRFGMICTVIMSAIEQIFGDKKRKPHKWQPSDFFPTEEKPKTQTADEMKQKLMSIAEAFK